MAQTMESVYTRRWSASYSMDFDHDTAALWEVISTPDILEACHPFCQSNKAIQWDKDGHSDVLVYLNGRTYTRRFQTWSEGDGFTLLIGEEGGPQSYVVWELTALSDQASRLTITVYPYILAKLPRVLALLPHILWVRPRLQKYLKSVISGFQYHIEHGEKVPRNHFGRHPWFS